MVEPQDGRSLDPGVTKERCKELRDQKWLLSKNQTSVILSHWDFMVYLLLQHTLTYPD